MEVHRTSCCIHAACWLGSFFASSTSVVADDPNYDRLVKPFLTQHCTKCHGEETQEGELRLDQLPLDFVGAMNATHWADILDRLNAGAMPPEDEPRPDADRAAAVVDWISRRFAEAEAARHSQRGPVGAHRLTREEYVHTVYDLLGVQFDAADPTGLLEDEEWHGFERVGSVLSTSPAHIEKYIAAAETILAEAFPVEPPEPYFCHKDAIDLRGNRELLTELGLAEGVRVDLWPGGTIQKDGGPKGSLPASGVYRVRIQLSGLKPPNGPAPHLEVCSRGLDRMLFEQDVIAAEDAPIVVEFETHLPSGGQDILISNGDPRAKNTPRNERAHVVLPFKSIKDGRQPWQMKLTDEQGEPILPFLIVDWVEWKGPMIAEQTLQAREDYFPTEDGNMAQARESLERFAARAFRRPVQATEVDTLVDLMQSEMASGEFFHEAWKTAMLAVLCSKDFCFIVEGDPEKSTRRLNDWELASRLSYFLWSSLPDDELLDAARAGTLNQPEELRSQVQRMLCDPKSDRFCDSFPRQWLQLHMVGMFPPDQKLYPEYDVHLERSMVRETCAFFREVLRENLTLREFLDSDWTLLNARLAEHYDISDVVGDDLRRVALRPDDHRGGVLTQASVLGLTSDGARHRPVHRGKWILESIIGQPPSPPPANVEPIEPTPADQPKATLRMKLAAHTTDSSCAACHRKIDPLGFAFENYDAIGRWRKNEVVTDGQGDHPPVDASGELADGRTFADAAEFKQLLIEDLDRFNVAFVEKLATYALRRTVSVDDRRPLAEVAEQSKAADYRLPAIIEALVLSDLFQER